MRTNCFVYGLAVSLALCLAASSRGQQAKAVGQDAATLASQAHKLAQAAKTLEQFTETLRVCGQALEASPSAETRAYVEKLAGWTYNKRGETLARLAEDTADRDAKRAAEYEQAALRDFGLAVRLDSTNWKPRYNRAVSLAVLGQYQEALADLAVVIEADAEHKNARFNRAEILYQLGEYQKAALDYDAVIELDPKDAAAFTGRGLTRIELDRLQDALLDLNAAIRLEPENAAAYADRADLYAAMGNWERAAGDYRVAVGLDDKLSRAYQNVAWLMATCPDQRFRNASLAVRAAKKSVELEGKNYLSLDTLAAALANAGQFDQAAATAREALTLAPAGRQEELQGRLALYQQQRAFRDAVDSQVQLASAEEPAE